MLKFLSHTKEDAVWERTLRAKFLNVGAWFPYINHNSIAIKINIIDFTFKVLMRNNTKQEPLNLLRLLLFYH